MYLPSRVPVLLASFLIPIAAGCADVSGPLDDAGALTATASMRAGLVCARVDLAGSAPLGFIPEGYEGAGGLGGMPAPTTFAGVTGMLHSYVTSPILPVGANAQGATHITLVHVFTAPSGSFFTEDRAVCGPMPGAPGTCRLSDQMTIAGGTGVCADAAGKLHNRGVLDFNTFTLTFHATGKVCGAGL